MFVRRKEITKTVQLPMPFNQLPILFNTIMSYKLGVGWQSQNLDCQLPKLDIAGLSKPEVGVRGNAHLFGLN
jgi:hypothetical protein